MTTRLVARVCLVATLPAVALVARSVDACEPYPCLPGSLLPAGGTIPANTPELRWHTGHNRRVDKPASSFSLTRDGKKVRVEFEPLGPEVWRVIPKEPWVEGAEYRMTADNGCYKILGPEQLESTFRVGPAAEFPDALGTVQVVEAKRGELQIATLGGSCNVREPAAWVDVQIELAKSAEPWASMIDYTTLMDGKAWRYAETLGKAPPIGESVLGRGKERIYAQCAAESHAFEGAGEGSHAVVLRGEVFATGEQHDTGPLTIDLSCSESTKPTPATDESSMPKPAAAPSSAAGGNTADPAPSKFSGATRSPDADDADGGARSGSRLCAVDTRASNPAAALLLTVLALVSTRRRRTRA